MTLDAYERCGLRAVDLKTEHFASARRSMNFVLTRWANRGVNLWKVDLVATPLIAGQTEVPVDPDVVSVLDVYVRQYPTGNPTTPNLTFATSIRSASVTVSGIALTAGAYLCIITPVMVGGLTLSGFYQVASVSSAGAVIQAATPATATESVSGVVTVASSVSGAPPTDFLLTPISRNDYAGLANKFQLGRPTSFWWDRILLPPITLWPVPDVSGVYEFRYYVCRQVEDATGAGGQTLDAPYRFNEAFASALAGHLAIKWAPALAPALLAYAEQCWTEASDEDREKVTLHIVPQVGGYFR